MSAAAELERPAVVGFVEARTAERVLGWAWDPSRPAERVPVALLDGETPVAEGIADQPREDLARNGVGDGAHAFAIPLPDAWRGRAELLAVAALGAGGEHVPLTAPPPVLVEPPPALVRLQRGIEQVAAGQRAVLRALRSPAEAQPAGEETLARIAATQARIEEQIGALEVFVTRLDQRLAALAEPAAVPRRSRRLVALAAVLGCAALAAFALAALPFV